MEKIAFIDRDGALIYEPPKTKQIDSIDKLQILPGVIEGLQSLIDEGYKLVMASNQDGLRTDSFPEEDFIAPQNEMLKIFKENQIEFAQIFICPHMTDKNCKCRKPKTGLVDAFLKKVKMDKEKSFVLGDRETDMKFAENLGIRGILTPTNGQFPRLASIKRTTNETDVFIQCNLDGKGSFQIDTGLNFFNHMLEQLSKQSLIDLTIKAKGDLEIDEHHTVEDVALTLGETLSKALGKRKGIKRYGFLLPMDETLIEVAIDLSGRPYLVFDTEFKREMVGDLPTELVEHFFKSLSDSLKANIHINVRYSKNEHHKIEAIFKSFARALRMAVGLDAQLKNELPTTKGKL